MPDYLITEQELDRYLEYLRQNFEETEEPLVAIQAFVAAIKNGREPDNWSLKFVTERFDYWLKMNSKAKEGGEHIKLDDAFAGGHGVQRNAFREAGTNTSKIERLKKVFLVQWAFDLRSEAAAYYATEGGFAEKLQTKEEDLAHNLRRKRKKEVGAPRLKVLYEVFCEEATQRGFSRRETARQLIDDCKHPKIKKDLQEEFTRAFPPE